MTYQPIVPIGGLAGWAFLERTMEKQTAAFNNGAEITRDTAYFEENIAEINTAEELVADRRLLRIALGAFGLQDDIDNKFFIQKILSEGTISSDALANKLSDTRYADLAGAFGFDLGTPRSKISDFASEITAKYRQQQFEVAVGNQDDNMRLALNAERLLPDLVDSESAESTKWYQILGNEPLRAVFQTALGFPDSFAQLDIDRQRVEFAERSESQLGLESLSDLQDPEVMDKLIQRFLLQAQIAEYNSSMSAGSIALTLLQS